MTKAPNETINWENVPQEHHPSLETSMASKRSRAILCFDKVVVRSQLNGTCKIPLKTRAMTRHYYVALLATFLSRDSELSYMIWNTLPDWSLSCSSWTTFLSPPHSDHVSDHPVGISLTLNIPSLARQRCLSSWGPRRTPWSFFVISQLFDAVDYSNYVFLGVSETIIQWFKHC